MKRWTNNAPASFFLLLLATLFALSAWIASVGIDFGSHWDEPVVMKVSVEHRLKEQTMLPGHYYYGGLIYLLPFVALAPHALEQYFGDAAQRDVLRHLADESGERRRKVRERLIPIGNSDPFRLEVRLLFAVVSYLGLLWIYWLTFMVLPAEHLGRGLRHALALLAAGLWGASWETSYHARWIAPDILLAQFAVLATALSVLYYQRGRLRTLAYAGAAAALCFSCKPQGLLFAVPVLLAALLTPRNQAALSTRLWVAVAGLGGVILVLNPWVVAEPLEYLDAQAFNLLHYKTGHQHAGYSIDGFFAHLLRMLEYLGLAGFSQLGAVSALILVLAAWGVVELFRRQLRLALIVGIAPTLLLILLATNKLMIVRNVLPVLPFLAVCAAVGTLAIIQKLPQGRWRTAPVAVVALIIVGNYVGSARAALSITPGQNRSLSERVAAIVPYVEAHDGRRLLLSPRLNAELSEQLGGSLQSAPANLATTTAQARQATHLAFLCEEENPRFLPANRHASYDALPAAPQDVNLDYYPSWTCSPPRSKRRINIVEISRLDPRSRLGKASLGQFSRP